MPKGQSLWASEESQSNHDQTTIGPFLFYNSIPKDLNKLLKHLYRNFRKNSQSLRIQDGRMKELIPQEALQIAECYRIEELTQFSLANNSLSDTSILQKCQFQNLLILNLSRNRLTSFAHLAENLHFDLLEQLILCSNQFTTMRGMKRWRMNMLNKLTLQLNFIVDIRELSQAMLPALSHLQIYANNIADFRPIFRVDFPKLQTLEICMQCELYQIQIVSTATIVQNTMFCSLSFDTCWWDLLQCDIFLLLHINLNYQLFFVFNFKQLLLHHTNS